MDAGHLLNRLQQYLFVKLEEAAANRVSDTRKAHSNLCVHFYLRQMVKSHLIIYFACKFHKNTSQLTEEPFYTVTTRTYIC